MAESVIAAGSSHGPSIQRPPKSWEKLAKRDIRGPRFDYAALQAKDGSGLKAEIAFRSNDSATRRLPRPWRDFKRALKRSAWLPPWL